MRILLLNGSPRGLKSNTLKISRAFVEGLRLGSDDVVEEVTLAQKHISDCRGCFTCWYKTPGKCVLHDDMSVLFEEQYLSADIVIWSFPLYFYSMPAQIKAFMDRTFLNEWPDMTIENGMPAHASRHDLSATRHIVISTCGFYTVERIYDAVLAQFRLAFGSAFAAHIFCAQGGCIDKRMTSPQVIEYFETIRRAGNEFTEQGHFTTETETALASPLFPPEIYMACANCIPGVNYALDHSDEQVMLQSLGMNPSLK